VIFDEFWLSKLKAGTVVKLHFDDGHFEYGHIKNFVTLLNGELGVLVITQAESEVVFGLDDIEIL
jgi:hypothetical protein